MSIEVSKGKISPPLVLSSRSQKLVNTKYFLGATILFRSLTPVIKLPSSIADKKTTNKRFPLLYIASADSDGAVVTHLL